MVENGWACLVEEWERMSVLDGKREKVGLLGWEAGSDGYAWLRRGMRWECSIKGRNREVVKMGVPDGERAEDNVTG